jgi:topoisomerase-4 subunit A
MLEQTKARRSTCSTIVQGPDFPTGGIMVEGPRGDPRPPTTGRGGFRVRARWRPRQPAAASQIVVTEIPYQVQKSQADREDRRAAHGQEAAAAGRRARRIAEDVRLVLEPKSRTVDPAC